jgi:polyhydroxybutyrate depolymerase
MLNSAGFNALAQQYRAVIAYPNGVNAGWNTQSGMPGASTADDVGYLLTLADSIRARWGTRYHRLFSCGFSAGGFMSYRLACERPDRFEAVASVAGTMSANAFAACQGPPLPPSYHVRLMHIHGTADGVVGYAGGNGNVSAEQCVQSWVSRAQCPSQPVVQTMPNVNTSDGSTVEEFLYAPCAPLGPVGTSGAGRPGQVVFLKVTGGGHTWPGNTAPLFGLGNVNRDFQATARIMDFFLGTGATATNPEPPNLPQKNPTWVEVLAGLAESKDPWEGLWDSWGRKYPVNRFGPLDPVAGPWLTRFQGQTKQWIILPK